MIDYISEHSLSCVWVKRCVYMMAKVPTTIVAERESTKFVKKFMSNAGSMKSAVVNPAI